MEMCVLRRRGAVACVSVETRTLKGSRSVLMRRARERRETLTARRMHRRVAARKRCMVVSQVGQAAAERAESFRAPVPDTVSGHLEFSWRIGMGKSHRLTRPTHPEAY